MATIQDIKKQIEKVNAVAGTDFILEKGIMGHGFKIGNKVFQDKESAHDSLSLVAQLVESGDWSAEQAAKNFERF